MEFLETPVRRTQNKRRNQTRYRYKSWQVRLGCCLVVLCLPSMHKDLSLIYSTTNKQTNKQKSSKPFVFSSKLLVPWHIELATNSMLSYLGWQFRKQSMISSIGLSEQKYRWTFHSSSFFRDYFSFADWTVQFYYNLNTWREK
jgi:hypothetical protein